MLLKIQQFCYNQVKEIVANSHKKWYLIKHHLELSFLTFNATRFAACLYFYYIDSEFEYWNYDLLCYFILHVGGDLNRLYIIIALMVSLLGIDGKYHFFLNKNLFPFQNLYWMIVKNIDEIRFCTLSKTEQNCLFNQLYNQQLKIFKNNPRYYYWPNFLLHIYCWLRIKFKFNMELKFIDNNKLKQIKSKTLFNKSLKLQYKYKLYKMSSIIDQLCDIIHYFVGKQN